MRLLTVLLLLCSSLVAQNSVTLGGSSYVLQHHPRVLLDGPGGSLDLRIKDPDGTGPLRSPKAVASNPAWAALSNAVTSALPLYAAESRRYPLRDGVVAAQFATYWYADNSQSGARTAALYMLNHVEYFLPLVCVETTVDCVAGGSGYGISSYGISYWMPNWILAYELMRSEMTPAERQTFAAKFLNDRAEFGGIDGAPDTSCTNPTSAAGANVTIGNPIWSVKDGSLVSLRVVEATAIVTLNGSTAGIQPGERIRIRSGTLWDTFLDVKSIDSPTQFSAGYINYPDGVYTAADMTIVYDRPYATVSAPVFGTLIKPGDWLFAPANAYNLGVLATVIDPTHAYLEGDMQPSAPDTLYFRPKAWSPGQCGVLWHVKHDEWTPPAVNMKSGSVLYPPSGGVNGADTGHNLVYSALWGLHLAFLSLVDDDANATVRSKAQLALAYDFWYNGPYTLARRYWTGFHQSGSGYGIVRAHEFMPGTAMAIQDSLVNGPDLLNGIWAKNLMVLDYANTFPNAQRAQMQWGQPDVSGGFGGMTSPNLIGFTMLSHWFRNEPEGSYANWWLRNLWAGPVNFGNAPGTNLGFVEWNIRWSAPAWFFVYTDDSYPARDLATSPTTFLLNTSDAGVVGQRADGIISRTGFAGATDTLLNFHAQMIPEFDHNVFANQASNYASYKIFKGHYLLAEDFGLDFIDPAANGFTVGGTGSNYVEVGGTEANLHIASFPIEVGIPRAAGNNRFAYAMADVTNAYRSSAGLLHGYRHLIDLKEPGTQQFIVDYVDFASSTGQTKKAYYHYPNKATTTLAGTVVTSGNSNADRSELLTQVLAPQPVLIASDTSGASFRLDVCPTADGFTCDGANTQADMIVVHMPAAGFGNSLPPVQLIPNIDAKFLGVQIAGSSPKAAIFARNGRQYKTLSFALAHAGLAQIVVSGLAAGVYQISCDGAAVGKATVAADGAVEFKGPAGSYWISTDQTPPSYNVSLTSSANPVTWGSATTLTATVPPSVAGSVVFYDGATALGSATLNPSGVASLAVSAMAPGDHSLTAAFTANGTAFKSAAIAQRVNELRVTVSLNSSANPSIAGQALTLTAAVSPLAAGTVAFHDGSSLLGTAAAGANGTAALSLSGLAPGAHNISASFTGTGITPATSAQLTQTVKLPVLTLTPSANPSTVTQTISLTATVSPALAGSVTFLDGSSQLGTAAVNAAGSATLQTGSLTVGTHTLTATFNAAGTPPVTSAAVLQTVRPPTVTLTSSANPLTVGQTLTLTTIIAPAVPGTVTFLDGSTVIGTTGVNGNGSATLSASGLALGPHVLTAVFDGASASGATSNVLTQAVNKLGTSLSLSSSANPSVVGQLVTLTANLSPSGTGGAIAFLDGSAVIGTAVLNNRGVAAIQTSALIPGTHSLTAVYAGDSQTAGSVSSVVHQIVSSVAPPRNGRAAAR